MTAIKELHYLVKTLSNDLPFYINHWLCDLGHVSIYEDRKILNERLVLTRTLRLTLEDERFLTEDRSLHTFNWELPLEGNLPPRSNFAVYFLADDKIYQKAESLFTEFYEDFTKNPQKFNQPLTQEALREWLDSRKNLPRKEHKSWVQSF